jgi:uncharacterized membrane protein YqjE
MTEFFLISTTVLLVAVVLMGVAVIILGEIDDRRRHDLAQLRREIDDLRRQILNRHNS